MSRPRVLVFALLAIAACERPSERQEARAIAARALRNVLAFPRSTIVSVDAGPEAAQVVLTTPSSVEVVATWYRQFLQLNRWDLRSDQVGTDGTISMYAADTAGRPLWITLKTNVGAPGTTYTLIGAALGDSSVVQRPGSSMSSNRIQRR